MKTASDYHKAIEQVTTALDISIGDISEKMNSSEYNIIFSDIEYQLNALYEKTRILEEINKYCKEYAMTKIDEKILKFQTQLKAIEQNADSYQDTSFIVYEIPFNNVTDTIRDRNGAAISKANVTNGNLCMSGQTIETPIFKSVSKQKTAYHYIDNIQNLINDKPYRSLYVEHIPVKGSITEKITIYFEEMKCNYVNIKTVGCKIIEANYIDSNDIEIPIVDVNNIYTNTQQAKGISIKIKADTYTLEEYAIDQNAIKEDAFNILAGNQTYASPALTGMYDLIMQIKSDEYNNKIKQYIYDTINWNNDKETINNKNLSLLKNDDGGNSDE